MLAVVHTVKPELLGMRGVLPNVWLLAGESAVIATRHCGVW